MPFCSLQAKHAGWATLKIFVNQPDQCQITERDRKILDVGAMKAAKDYERFLLLRAKELKPGGMVVMVMSATASQDGSEEMDAVARGFGRLVKQGVLDTIQDFVDEGVWTKEEGEAAYCHAYVRSKEEMLKPFSNPESPVRKAGLSLVHYKAYCFPCAFEKAFLDGTLSKADYAKKSALSIRTYLYQFIYNALSTERSEAERQELVDRFFDRTAAKWAKNDGHPALPHPVGLVVVQKGTITK